MAIFDLCCGSSTAGIYEKTVKSTPTNSVSDDEDIPDDDDVLFLHGILYVDIIEAKDLPDLDNFPLLRHAKDVSDPYVTVDTVAGRANKTRIIKTRVIDDNLTPKWRESFRVELCSKVETLFFSVKDQDFADTAEHMGFLSIPALDLLDGKNISGWHDLADKAGERAGSIHLNVRFVSAQTESDASTNEVPSAVFPMRTACRVRLYQDAVTPALPPVADVKTRDGRPYRPPQLWEEIARDMDRAQKLIYIVGWSVNVNISLVRDANGDARETLGELLKRKAAEGVRVLMILWDEALNSQLYPPGFMGTHDEETKAYFAGTEVEVLLCPRKKANAKIGEHSFVTTVYTHHQKCVILDKAVCGNNMRRLAAYQGGIDLTDGRYDSFHHQLFETLPTLHKDDFLNGVVTSTNKSIGPREPWHDIHMYVEGEAAYDLLANFTERWQMQGSHKEHQRLLPITEQHGFDLDWSATVAGGDAVDNRWNVQLFRSINADSAQFPPNAMDKLLTRKGRLYENSIQRAYIHHIRRAKHFIYIENQYFLGSAYAWSSETTTKAPNLIPIELARRIVSAIENGENFRVYVVIPLHPEGDPTSSAVQEILHWQYKTQEMMYAQIARAISANGLGEEVHPTDYLAFFCLGKREGPENIPENYLSKPDSQKNKVAARIRDSKRFMIYVHSKLAIFGDEYAIVGSANINERSMNGNRDTEMCLGVHQPSFTNEECGGLPHGEVSTFRRALWAEHCGSVLEGHVVPSSLNCIRTMKDIGRVNLEKYLSNGVERNASHLLKYPLDVSQDGKLTPVCESFPDTGGSVAGTKSAILPNSLTT